MKWIKLETDDHNVLINCHHIKEIVTSESVNKEDEFTCNIEVCGGFEEENKVCFHTKKKFYNYNYPRKFDEEIQKKLVDFLEDPYQRVCYFTKKTTENLGRHLYRLDRKKKEIADLLNSQENK